MTPEAREVITAAREFDEAPGAISGLAKVAALGRLRQALDGLGRPTYRADDRDVKREYPDGIATVFAVTQRKEDADLIAALLNEHTKRTMP